MRNSRSPTPTPSTRSPTPKSHSKSPTPKTKASSSSHKSSSRRSSQTNSQNVRKVKSSQPTNQTYPSFVYELDIYDWVLIALSIFFFFVFFTVDHSNIDVKDKSLEKLDYRSGLKNFYLLLISLLVISFATKKYIQQANKK